MLRNIIHRPIAVTMILIALTAVGILAFMHIPVSLMPKIDIPLITVQLSNPGASVNEIEQQLVTPMRQRLSQVAGLKEIESQSRMDAGIITLTFEPGANMDLLFIDVNEKIDRAMGSMPEGMNRPKVIKASAMDIPAFYIDIAPRSTNPDPESQSLQMAKTSTLVRNVIVKRIEQLEQTAMVDYSGSVGSEIQVVPDMEKMESLGLTNANIENAIQENNLVLGALNVASGIYRYSIHFDEQILCREDIEQIWIRHQGRMIQMGDICQVIEKPAVRNGIVRSNGKDAITLAVIKQNDARMEDLQQNMNQLMERMAKDYPELTFQITRDQTELLTYSMHNLEWNLVLGALLACVILFVFNGGWRTPLLIIISIPLSLILTLLVFYLMGISLNIISLSGLILGVGMIVDNAIIVIDNIRQRGDVVLGTKEVFMPMLSSVLTTCSVFIPLIFLSGTAGALFFDQAMGVTIALFASLAVASLVVPVYYYSLQRKDKSQGERAKGNAECDKATVTPAQEHRWAERRLLTLYEPGMRWTLRHSGRCLVGFGLAVVCILAISPWIKKERMPEIAHDDALMTIDWNAGIAAEENDRRVCQLLDTQQDHLSGTTSMVGAQEFILSHTRNITGNEAVVYLKAHSAEALDSVKVGVTDWMSQHYPQAKVEFEIAGNIYDIIFQTNKPDLQLRLQRKEGGRPSTEQATLCTQYLQQKWPQTDIQPVATEEVINLSADPERLAYYHVSYSHLYNKVRELIGSSQVYEISSGGQSIPVIVGQERREVEQVLQSAIRTGDGIDVPLSYLVQVQHAINYKRLSAGSEGEYVPISIEHATDATIDEIIQAPLPTAAQQGMDAVKCTLHGNYFEARDMIQELLVVLIVAISLLYFILAAQFESLVQPAIILTEIVIDVCIVMLVLWVMGESLNIMSMIGMVVMSGIIINDSILKVDTINRLYRSGMPLLKSIVTAGHRRLKPIVMTSLTTILALLPFLHRGDMGSAMQYPLSLTLIVGMTVGTLVSLYFVPLIYYIIYARTDRRRRATQSAMMDDNVQSHTPQSVTEP
ncbi:MAG: efflux RND transporter permease subunit [Bacteroidales bacterium]|nr:efflux RND transporter permease subunit [Bacteroidales bacterium]